MSRIVRKQLLSAWEAMLEAHQTLNAYIEECRIEDSLALLTDCQEGAISMGGLIEEVYGKELGCVHRLEEYCEALFHTAEHLEDPKESIQQKYIADQWLEIVREEMEQEIPDRLEVVFFPYKASMWDSLESVYLAAREDPDCDAYCVPIPYYDLNPDKSFGEFHDESREYPKGIEITGWQDYDFETRKPDMIFIHNPYDSWNSVTSVEPRFYASNLRKYTEKLVYIPYFVFHEIHPTDQCRIDCMKHFCFLPGVIYADRVIVQSEDMRRIYINEYRKAAEAYGLKVDSALLETKILGLGSPKFDQVQNTERQEIELPEEWQRILQKPDGDRKNVILYNISIPGILAQGEKMLEKVCNVFQIFKEKKDETALWFRPHPLIPSTLQSMRPELWNEYKKIIDEYQKEGWGIYDDTADLNRAVMVTDAYYGDQSSVVCLYQKVGKKVLIQNVHVIENADSKKYDPCIVQSVRINNRLWFVAANYNGIFSVNLENGKTDLEGMLYDEEMDLMHLTGAIGTKGDYLIMTPVIAKNVQVFDLEKKENILIDGDSERSVLSKYTKFSGMIIDGEKVYFFPGKADTILWCDMANRLVGRVEEFCTAYKKNIGGEYNYFSYGSHYVYNRKAYFALWEAPYIMEFSLETEKIIFYWVDYVCSGFSCMTGNKNIIYLLSNDNRIVQWNIDNSEVINVSEDFSERQKELSLLRVALYDNGKIYLVSFTSDTVVIYDIVNEEIEYTTFEKKWNIPLEVEEKYAFSYYDLQQNMMYVVSNKSHLCILKMTGEISKILNMSIQTEEIEQYIQNGGNSKVNMAGVLRESAFFVDLPIFFQLVNKKNDKKIIDENIGETIYLNIKD